MALPLDDPTHTPTHAAAPPDGRAPTSPPAAARPPAAWRVLAGYARPHWHRLLLGGVLSLCTSGAGLLLPLATRNLVDNLGRGRPVAGVLLVMTALVLVNGVLGAVGSYVLKRTAESVVRHARDDLVAHLLRLRVPAVDRSEPGELMSRVTADTTLLRSVTSDASVGAVTGALTLVATVAMMAVLDAVLLGVALGVLALAGAVMGCLLPRIRRASTHAQEAVGRMGAALERALGSLRTIKAFGAEQREEERVRQAARDSWHAGVRAARWQAVAGNASGLAGQVAFLAVLGVGGARVATGAVDIGTLIAFLMYVFFLFTPVNQLLGAVTEYQVGAAAVTRIQQTLRLPVEPTAPGATPPAPGAAPATVVFADVHFSYRPDLPQVHRGVSFTVPSGGMTAFVGPSGAGKSTVFSLIERFHEPTAGAILLDGVDVREWDLPRLRATCGYVAQDAPVLSGSLRENLLLGAPDADEAELRRILALTRLDALVDRLPQGLDTLVGHRGTRLSGGERQRVAIGRALLRRPRLLLLDEATSQLDAANEAALRDTILAAARETTVLTVAHRLSTVLSADRIVVMDAGVVRAVGTHAHLVVSDPLYRDLAATQFLAPTAPSR